MEGKGDSLQNSPMLSSFSSGSGGGGAMGNLMTSSVEMMNAAQAGLGGAPFIPDLSTRIKAMTLEARLRDLEACVFFVFFL